MRAVADLRDNRKDYKNSKTHESRKRVEINIFFFAGRCSSHPATLF
jgi:hypothetical protein